MPPAQLRLHAGGRSAISTTRQRPTARHPGRRDPYRPPLTLPGLRRGAAWYPSGRSRRSGCSTIEPPRPDRGPWTNSSRVSVAARSSNASNAAGKHSRSVCRSRWVGRVRSQINVLRRSLRPGHHLDRLGPRGVAGPRSGAGAGRFGTRAGCAAGRHRSGGGHALFTIAQRTDFSGSARGGGGGASEKPAEGMAGAAASRRTRPGGELRDVVGRRAALLGVGREELPGRRRRRERGDGVVTDVGRWRGTPEHVARPAAVRPGGRHRGPQARGTRLPRGDHGVRPRRRRFRARCDLVGTEADRRGRLGHLGRVLRRELPGLDAVQPAGLRPHRRQQGHRRADREPRLRGAQDRLARRGRPRGGARRDRLVLGARHCPDRVADQPVAADPAAARAWREDRRPGGADHRGCRRPVRRRRLRGRPVLAGRDDGPAGARAGPPRRRGCGRLQHGLAVRPRLVHGAVRHGPVDDRPQRRRPGEGRRRRGGRPCAAG